MVTKRWLLLMILSGVILTGCKTTTEGVTEPPLYIFPAKPSYSITVKDTSSDRAILSSYYAGEDVNLEEVIAAYANLLKATGVTVSEYDGFSIELELYIDDIIKILEKRGAEVWVPPRETSLLD